MNSGNVVALNHTNLLSYSAGDKKAEIYLTEVKSQF